MAKTVLGVERVIGMTGAIERGDIGVVFAPLILIPDQDREKTGASCAPLEDTRQNLGQIVFRPLGDDDFAPADGG